MSDGTILTYFMHPLTNGGANSPEEIRNNILSVECHVRLAWQRCPEIRPVVPQSEWACLIGYLDYDTAMRWCIDRLSDCTLAFHCETGEGPLAGQQLILSEGVSRELRHAGLMVEKEELELFTDRDLMASYIHDLQNGVETYE